MPALRVGRDAVLQCLEAVYPGISPKNIIEQSGSFVFRGGRVYTFNDETACRMKSPFDPSFEAAVPAGVFLDLLRKLPDDDLDFEMVDGELVISGKRKKTGISAEANITLPIDSMEFPGKEDWQDLPEDFCDAIGIVQDCAGTDATIFTMTCVHIHPKWVEACDNFQLARYTIKTGLKKPTLVKRESIKNIVNMGMTKFAETANWLHFKNGTGMVMSCRRYAEDYEDMSRAINMTDGEQTTLPKSLAEAVDRSEIFSSQNADDSDLYVELRKGAVRIRGVGATGWHQEVKKMVYNGPAREFRIAPKILREICQKYNDCLIGETQLKVDGGRFIYVSSLEVPDGGKSDA